jgi:hypothetical protein
VLHFCGFLRVGVRWIGVMQVAVRTHCVVGLRTRDSIDLSCWEMQQTETSGSKEFVVVQIS